MYAIQKEIPPNYQVSLGEMIHGSGGGGNGKHLNTVYRLYSAGKCPAFDSTYFVGYFTNDNGFDAGITISRELRTVTISFRGTEEVSDWITNFKSSKTCMRIPGIDIPKEAMVHLGAWEQLSKDDCIGQIARVVYEISQQFENDDLGKYYIVVTGHSLGGGLAVIFTYIMRLCLEQTGLTNDRRKILSIAYNPAPYINDYISEYLEKSDITNICLYHEYDPLYTLTHDSAVRQGYTAVADKHFYKVDEQGNVRIVPKDEPPEWSILRTMKETVVRGWDVINAYHSFRNFAWIDELVLVGSGESGGSVGGGSVGGGSVGGGSGGSAPANPAKVLIEEHERLMRGVAPPTTQRGVAPPTKIKII